MSNRHLADNPLEGNGGNVVAFVDHNEPVRPTDFAQVVPTSKRLRHGDVDDSLCLVSAAAELTDLLGGDTEVFGEAISPLLDPPQSA